MKKTFQELAQFMHQNNPDCSFAIEFWDGDSIRFGEAPEVTLQIKSKSAARAIIGEGFLGFGEAYMADQVEVQGNLQELLRLGLSVRFDEIKLSLWKRFLLLLSYLRYRDTLKRSPKNIAHHYNLGNQFYAQYLDETMTYSCAYFENPEDSLHQAQLNKYEHVCRKLLLKPGESLLDIGCGWGGMLIYAAQKYGIYGVGNTLSKPQVEYARQKIKEAGLEDRIKILHKDYRELEGRFDKVVSIGMFEHVGKAFIPQFVKKVAALLKEKGLGLLHTIGKDYPSPGDPWTLKYIFPGGYIPTLSETVEALGKAGFSILDVENLRMHYAKTLDHWAENFESNIDALSEFVDRSLLRRWRLFLNASAVGFKYGHSRLFQILFSHGLNNELPLTRRHLYST
ncbi:MAG: cyclopropane-fatty-acyl-phospholipid synthase family protein [Calditrichia bacterium]